MSDMNILLPQIALRFAIEHPSYEESYCFGYECAVAEMQEADNPFHKGCEEYAQWQEGWWDGFYGDAPLFQITQPLENALPVVKENAANEQVYHHDYHHLISRFLNIAGALTATAFIGYQIISLVA